MRWMANVAALAIAGVSLAGCGSADEAGDTEAVTATSAEGETLASADGCRPDLIITKVSQASSAVQKLPEDHPNYDGLRTAAGKMIDRFNALESGSEGGSREERLAGMCDAYAEFLETEGADTLTR